MGNQQIDVLWAKKSEIPSGISNYKTSHIFYHFIYVLDGEGWFVCGDHTFRIKKDSCVLIPPHVLHELPAHEHNLLSFLEIKFNVTSPYLAEKLANVFPLISGTSFIKSATTYVVANWMRNDLDTRRNIDYILTTLLLTLFLEKEASIPNASVFLNTDGYSDLTQKIIFFIEENYDSAFSLNTLAKHLGTSASYLCTAFKKNTNHTITEYLNYVRVRSALSCLYFGDFGDIFAVALTVGFVTQAHFNRVFKNMLGVTPSSIRSFFKSERDHYIQQGVFQTSTYEAIIGDKRVSLEESMLALKALGTCCKNAGES